MPPSPNPSPRLLFLQNSSLWESYGGVEYYLDDLLTLIGEMQGPDSVAALIPRREGSRAPDKSARPYDITWVPFRASGLLRKLENRFSPRLLRAALGKARSFRPDWLVCGHVSLGPLVYALHRLTGIPYVTCVYGIDCWGKLPRPIEGCLRRADRIFSISRWTKQILVERGYSASQIEIIHPRLTAEYERISSPADPPVRPAGERFRLLTVARLDPRERYKGQDHVIEALYHLRQSEPELLFHYTIQGDGSDRGRLEQLAADRGLQGTVHFRPGVAERKDLGELYRQADLFVMPSRYGFWDGSWRGEGFGIVYVEAAAYGIPSVAYDCGGATDIIENGVTGILVQPDNIPELARTLSFLARNRKRVKELGRNAYESALRNFSRPAIRGEIQHAFEALCGSSHRAAPRQFKAS